MFCEFNTTVPLCFVIFCSKDGGVDLLEQLQTNALNHIDSLFTNDEMWGHLFIKSARSKSTRELLPQDCVKKFRYAYVGNTCTCVYTN